MDALLQMLNAADHPVINSRLRERSSRAGRMDLRTFFITEMNIPVATTLKAGESSPNHHLFLSGVSRHNLQ